MPTGNIQLLLLVVEAAVRRSLIRNRFRQFAFGTQFAENRDGLPIIFKGFLGFAQVITDFPQLVEGLSFFLPVTGSPPEWHCRFQFLPGFFE